MKRLIFLILTFTLMVITAFRISNKTESDKVTVIELFTSQGCSSCPSADRLLSQVADNKNVIALSFHVSYWNYLGWKDPYSREEFTKRQRNYGNQFNLQSIYTPQMVVNGSKEFVGSDKSKLNSSLLTIDEQIPIKIGEINQTDGALTFNYTIAGEVEGLVLNIALVERHVKNYVPRGENAGKTLAHDNVVRYFDTVTAKKNGLLNIKIPEFTSNERLVILYLQDAQLKVEGATKVSF